MDFIAMDRDALRDYATTDDLLDLIEELRAKKSGPTSEKALAKEAGPDYLSIMYTNWQGESHRREVIPERVYWGSTARHPEPQWLMEAFDVNKQEVCRFAMKDMHSYVPRTVQIDCPDVETGRVELMGFHLTKALVWTHSKMEYRAFDLSFVKPVS